MCLNTASLDHYAAMFHDFPCRATAQRYEAQAIAFAASCVIRIDELENILSLVWPFLEVKQGPLA
jgi:hypothetical protein